MRASTQTALARVVKVFGEARAHHAYLFANRRASRMKVVVHDEIGVWLCARAAVASGPLTWSEDRRTVATELTSEQLRALVIGLPRTDVRHEPDSTICGCGCQMKRIGEDISEKLDYVPGVFTVERHVRGKWACAKCQTLIQAPVPAQVIDKGIATAGLLAQVLVSKYADHMPLYRQEQMFGRAGLAIPRSTLGTWVGICGVRLQPLVDAYCTMLTSCRSRGRAIGSRTSERQDCCRPRQRRRRRRHPDRTRAIIDDFGLSPCAICDRGEVIPEHGGVSKLRCRRRAKLCQF